jgi:hypothetical protein
MPAPLIPWHVFFRSLRKRKSKQIETWLGLWAFSDAGAASVDGSATHDEKPLPIEEKQKRAVHFLMTMGKGPKLLH